MKNNKWNIPGYVSIKEVFSGCEKSILRIFLMEYKKFKYGYITLLSV